MKSDVWKKLSLIIITAGFAIFTSLSLVNAQDNFREFDRRMVPTPSELFEHLSSLQPSELRKRIAEARRKELEKAGREFLSRLSPEQKEKAWEFAEKYLRKNGVDSTSSQKLMEQFGLPPEMQKELSKQFRRHQDRLSDSETQPDPNADNAIDQILRKARDNFRADATNKGNNPGRTTPSNLPGISKPGTGEGGDKRSGGGTQPNTNKEQPQPSAGGKRKETKAGTSNPTGENRNSNRNAGADQQKRKTRTDRTNSQDKDPGVPEPFKPRLSDQAPKSNRGNQNRRNTSRSQKAEQEKDVDLQRLMGEFEEFRKKTRSNSETTRRNSSQKNNLDWEEVIKELAEKGTDLSRTPGEDALTGTGADDILNPAELDRAERRLRDLVASGRLDPEDLNKVNELIRDTVKARKKAESRGWGRSTPKKSSAPSEKVGTRFDRLLVQAAERTLGSEKDEDDVSQGVSSILGSLIENVQEQAKKKDEERRREKDRRARNLTKRKLGQLGEISGNPGSPDSGTNNSNDNSGGNSYSGSDVQNEPDNPESGTSSLDPQALLDSIPDLSSINPTQIFTFFAIVGLILFVGYLLAQSFVGSEEAASQRKFIKEIRAKKIDSPKDLVETVDTFLLAKFGIKSSWWNAGLAQKVLNSGSSEFQARVDELIQDYVRARYMRDDIQIPEADQQRYRKTLEELSLLDIKPVSELGFVSANPVLNSPASVEG